MTFVDGIRISIPKALFSFCAMSVVMCVVVIATLCREGNTVAAWVSGTVVAVVVWFRCSGCAVKCLWGTVTEAYSNATLLLLEAQVAGKLLYDAIDTKP